jgi:hypothetical protein
MAVCEKKGWAGSGRLRLKSLGIGEERSGHSVNLQF